MKKRYVFIIAALLLFACKEAYNPPVSSPVTGYLVVEGFINSGNGVSTVKLTRTTKLVDTAAIIYEHNALVQIEDENNTTYPLLEKDSGNYVSDNLSLSAASKYRIHIKTTDGNEYVSDFSTVKQTPPIDSVTWHVENGGVQIYLNAHDPTDSAKYYQVKYSETWEFHSAYLKTLDYIKDPVSGRLVGLTIIAPDTSIYKCWRTQNPSNIILVSTEKLSEDQVYLPIRYIEQNADELSVLYYIEVKLYALSHEAYLFEQKLKKNTEELGSIFDAQPSELEGNIHCTTNPALPAIGYIEVAQEQVAKLFIHNSELSNWPPHIGCSMEVVDNDPSNYDADVVPVSVHEMSGLSIKSFNAAAPICVDCTLRGTNVRPPFWP